MPLVLKWWNNNITQVLEWFCITFENFFFSILNMVLVWWIWCWDFELGSGSVGTRPFPILIPLVFKLWNNNIVHVLELFENIFDTNCSFYYVLSNRELGAVNMVPESHSVPYSRIWCWIFELGTGSVGTIPCPILMPLVLKCWNNNII